MQPYVVFFSLFQESLACIGLLAGLGLGGNLSPPNYPAVSFPAPSYPAPSFPAPSFPAPAPSFPAFPPSPNIPSFPQVQSSFPQPPLPQMFPQGPIVGGQNFPGGQFGSFPMPNFQAMPGLQGPMPPEPQFPQENAPGIAKQKKHLVSVNSIQSPQTSQTVDNLQSNGNENLPTPQDWCFTPNNEVGPAGDTNSRCFLNNNGFQCCNHELNDLLNEMVTTASYMARWRGCNNQRMVTDIQRNVESRFNMKFETFVGSDNVCGRHNFLSNWMCKTRLENGKTIVVYAHPVANGYNLESSQSWSAGQNGSGYLLPTSYLISPIF